jgi:hypothetical protein
VDSSEAAAIAQQAELNLENMQQTLSEKIDDRPMNEAQQRMESPTGQAMFRKCAEWTEFYDNHPSDDSRANRDKTCAEYKDFVDNGVEPEQR